MILAGIQEVIDVARIVQVPEGVTILETGNHQALRFLGELFAHGVGSLRKRFQTVTTIDLTPQTGPGTRFSKTCLRTETKLHPEQYCSGWSFVSVIWWLTLI